MGNLAHKSLQIFSRSKIFSLTICWQENQKRIVIFGINHPFGKVTITRWILNCSTRYLTIFLPNLSRTKSVMREGYWGQYFGLFSVNLLIFVLLNWFINQIPTEFVIFNKYWTGSTVSEFRNTGFLSIFWDQSNWNFRTQ